MMRTLRLSFLLGSILFISCSNGTNQHKIESWKQEILNTEKEFSDLAQTDGIRKAFLTFAADSAVLMRNNKLIKGKIAIEHYFEQLNPQSPDVSLVWKPDFVDVSASGDLGYTYGNYTFSRLDSIGQKINNKGVFHTVWKRQEDGSWKFVWD